MDRSPLRRRTAPTPPGAARALALAVLAALAAGACGESGATIEVAAASSLRHALPRIARDFERAHPGLGVGLRFHGSQVLATQIEEGADADLFVSADPLQAERLARAGLAERSAVVTANRLVVAVAADSPWRSLGELAASDARIAAGTPAAPVGALARAALALLPPELARGLRGRIATEDPSVRIVLSRLELGEADAAFVYHSDIALAPGLRALALPPGTPPNEYVAVLLAGADPAAAALFGYLLGPEAQAIFRGAGFLPAVAGVRTR